MIWKMQHSKDINSPQTDTQFLPKLQLRFFVELDKIIVKLIVAQF